MRITRPSPCNTSLSLSAASSAVSIQDPSCPHTQVNLRMFHRPRSFASLLPQAGSGATWTKVNNTTYDREGETHEDNRTATRGRRMGGCLEHIFASKAPERVRLILTRMRDLRENGLPVAPAEVANLIESMKI